MYQVLIVDDEPIVKIALRSIITWNDLGFHICATASNGEEALEMAGRFHPNLIICDLKMPIMDGLELIKAVQERKMDCGFLVISNYEDFNYVRTALVLGASDYILKVSISPEELTEQLEKIKEKLDQKSSQHEKILYSKDEVLLHQEQQAAWQDFFTHKSYELNTLENITGLSQNKPLGSLSLCQISFDWYAQNLEPLPSAELLRNTLKNALEQFDRRRIIFFSANNTLLVLPESQLKLHHKTIAGLSARIAQFFQYYMSLSPAILYQSGIPDLIEARNVYHNFQELLELGFYGPLAQVDAEKLTVSSAVPDVSYKELAMEILTIPDKTLEYASLRLTKLLDSCKKNHVMPTKVIQYCARLLGELEYHVSGITTIAHDQIADSADIIRNVISLEELSKNLMDALQAIFAPKQPSCEASADYSPEVIQALSYIQNNYSRKISLTSVAEHVGLSSGYLCRIFKEETSVSINAYINSLRMTKAAELLKDNNSYIKEVAISVGFEDQLYFSRQFKRYYGVTPSEYRSFGHS